MKIGNTPIEDWKAWINSPGEKVREEHVQHVLDHFLLAIDKLEEFESFAKNIRDNFDHDIDAHRWDTPCPMCEAEKLLKEK